MKLDPEALEAAIKAACRQDGSCAYPHCRDIGCTTVETLCRGVPAYLAHLRAKGVALMPREPQSERLSEWWSTHDVEAYQAIWDAHDKEQNDDR